MNERLDSDFTNPSIQSEIVYNNNIILIKVSNAKAIVIICIPE